MKRTAKILSFVLAIMLIFSVTAVASFAAAEDITVAKQANFDAGSVDTGVSWIANTAVGGTAVVEGANGNYYWKFTKADSYTNANYPYFHHAFNRQALDATGTAFTNTNYQISNFKFISYEVDIMSPTGSFMNCTIDPYWAAIKTGTTANTFWNSQATQNLVRIYSDETGSYISPGFDSNIKVYINPYEFTHIQIVWENTSPADDIQIKGTVYVNGELAYSKEAKASNFAKTEYAIEPHVSFYHSKFNVDIKTCDANDTLAVDNVKVSTVPAGSATVESDLLTYDAANKPFGTAVAKVGEVEYDNLAKAIEAAPQAGTVTLLANVATPITVSKIVTVEAGEYTADLRAGAGYAVDDSTEGVYKVVSSAGQTVEILFDECYCDDPCDDYASKHPVYHYVEEAAIFTKILDLYNPTYTGFVGDDGVIYNLVGWKNNETQEMITENTQVTEDDVSVGYIDLAPVYEVAELDMQYIKNGKVVYVGSGTGVTLNDVVAAADAGSTITLLSDLDITSSVTVSGKAITIDLNGYTIKAISTSGKWSLFLLRSGCDLTVTSSKVGAKIFNNGFNNATTSGAAGMFNTNNNISKLTVNGKDAQGNQSLTLISDNIIQGYQNALEFHLNGGIYICPRGDQQGAIDLRAAGTDATIDGVLVYSAHSDGFLSYAGRNTPTDLDATVTIDNSVIYGKAFAGIVYPVVIKMTNTYVYGDVNVAISGTYKTMAYGSGTLLNAANTPATVVLGEGVYISGNVSENVTFEEGFKLYDVPATKEITYYKNTWTVADTKYADSSFVINTFTETLAFGKQTSDKVLETITVTWKNAKGEVIGTSEALPGNMAIVPVDIKGAPFIEGWLNYIPAEWNESLLIPEDATEYTITEKEGGAYTLAAAPKLLLSYSMQSHFRLNLFVPEVVEGIEVTSLSINTTSRNYETAAKNTINGMGYRMVNIWPGMLGSTNDNTASISFTYGGETYSVTTAPFNTVSYIQYILDTEGYSEDAKVLAANLANYIYSGAVAVGSAKADLFATVVNNNTDRLIKLSETEKTTLPDTSAIADAVTGVSATIDNDGYCPSFVFTIADGANVQITAGTAGTGTITVTKAYFYNINNMQITVTPAEGDPIVVTYTIANYYAQLAALGNTSAATLNLVEAMHGLAVADANY